MCPQNLLLFSYVFFCMQHEQPHTTAAMLQDRPYGTIRSVQFGIIQNKTIPQISVAEVNDVTIHKGGVVKQNGINASSMGTMASNMLCSTCGSDTEKCQGHFGRIDLVQPVVNVEFLKVMFKVLSCVCFNCSSLLVPRDHPKYGYIASVESPTKRRSLLAALSARIPCCRSYKDAKSCRKSSSGGGSTAPAASLADLLSGDPSVHCGSRQPVYAKTDSGIRCLFPVDLRVLERCVEEESLDKLPVLTPRKMLQILQNIRPADVTLLGLDPAEARPEDMMWTSVLVPPICLRPTKGNVFGTASKIVGEDDLTKRLRIVLKLNKLLGQVTLLRSGECAFSAPGHTTRAPLSPALVPAGSAGLPAGGGAAGEHLRGFPAASAFSQEYVDLMFPFQAELVPAASSSETQGIRYSGKEAFFGRSRSPFQSHSSAGGILDRVAALSPHQTLFGGDLWKHLGLHEPQQNMLLQDTILSTYSFKCLDSRGQARDPEDPAESFLACVYGESSPGPVLVPAPAPAPAPSTSSARMDPEYSEPPRTEGACASYQNVLTWDMLAELVTLQAARRRDLEGRRSKGGSVTPVTTVSTRARWLGWVADCFIVSRKPVAVSNKSLFPTGKSCALEVYLSLQRNLASYQDNRTKLGKEDYFQLCRRPVVVLGRGPVRRWVEASRAWLLEETARVLESPETSPFEKTVVGSLLAQALPGIPRSRAGIPGPSACVAASLFPSGPGALQLHVARALGTKICLPFEEKAKSFSLSSGKGGKASSNISHILSNKRPRASLRSRLNGDTSKLGKMRKTVCGKRQNQSARTVITPDTNIEPDELGVPVHIAMTLTYPAKVCLYNHHMLLRAVRRGPFRHGGANFVRKTRQGGKMVSLQYGRRDFLQLEAGDVVYRHLVDGDLVIFNRQPSLHKHSLMAHRVKVVQGKSFRVHMAVTKSYNADFDGDEMVMQVVLTEKGRAEAREIMAVGKNMLKDGHPIVTFQQHSVAAAFLLSTSATVFPRAKVFQLASQSPHVSLDRVAEVMGERASCSGRDIISMLLPRSLYVLLPGDPGGRPEVRVEAGKLLSGEMDKRALNDGILMAIWKDIGEEEAFRFLAAGHRVFEAALATFGLTVGIDDCHFPRSKRDSLLVDRAMEFADRFPAHTPSDTHPRALRIEQKISTVMGKARDSVGETVMRCMEEARGRDGGAARGNKLKEIIDSGAKGNLTNIVQIAAMVGQQCDSVSSRMSEKVRHFSYQTGRRAEAHGMISRSFFGGLTSTSFFYHLHGARAGLVDTAVKTSETGYSQRKISYAMMDLVLQHSGCVSAPSGAIVQFVYGNDGFPSEPMERVTLSALGVQEQTAFLSRYSMEGIGDAAFALAHRAELARLRDLQQRVLASTVGLPSCHYATSPVNFARLNLRHKRREKSPGRPLTPLELLRAVERFWTRGSWSQGRRSSSSLFYASDKFQLLFRDYLSTKRLWDEVGLRTQEGLASLLKDLTSQLLRCAPQPGESVGMKASQNCSEPFTQLALNRFHISGQFNQLVSGVARMKEIINAISQPKTPWMMIALLPHDHGGAGRGSCRTLGSAEECEYLRAEELGGQIVCVLGSDLASGFDVATEEGGEDDSPGRWRRRILAKQSLLWGLWRGDDRQSALFDQGANMLMFVHLNPASLVRHRCTPGMVAKSLEKTSFGKKLKNMHERIFFYQGMPDGNVAHGPWVCLILDKRRKDGLYKKTWDPLKQAQYTSHAGAEPPPPRGQDSAVANQIYQKIIKKLHVRGVPGIRDFFIDQVNLVSAPGGTGTSPSLFSEQSRNVIITKGSNLNRVLEMRQVDASLTTTNDIREIERVLGIDAARKAIEENWTGVMQNNNAHVGIRHVQLISRAMCSKGSVRAMTYNGICGGKSSVVKKASFEKAQDSFLKGAVRGQRDAVTSTMDAICWNSDIRAGTNLSRTQGLAATAHGSRSLRAADNYSRLLSRRVDPSPMPLAELRSMCNGGKATEEPPGRPGAITCTVLCATSKVAPLHLSYTTSAKVGGRDELSRKMPEATVQIPSVRVVDRVSRFKESRIKSMKADLRSKGRAAPTVPLEMFSIFSRGIQKTEEDTFASSPKSPVYVPS